MEELLAFLDIQCEHKLKLLNSYYKNDSGQSCEDWAKGSLTAYIEVRSFVQKMLADPQETLVKVMEEATKPKRYLVTWTEIVDCSAYLDAMCEEDAQDMAEEDLDILEGAVRETSRWQDFHAEQDG